MDSSWWFGRLEVVWGRGLVGGRQTTRPLFWEIVIVLYLHLFEIVIFIYIHLEISYLDLMMRWGPRLRLVRGRQTTRPLFWEIVIVLYLHNIWDSYVSYLHWFVNTYNLVERASSGNSRSRQTTTPLFLKLMDLYLFMVLDFLILIESFRVWGLKEGKGLPHSCFVHKCAGSFIVHNILLQYSIFAHVL